MQREHLLVLSKIRNDPHLKTQTFRETKKQRKKQANKQTNKPSRPLVTIGSSWGWLVETCRNHRKPGSGAASPGVPGIPFMDFQRLVNEPRPFRYGLEATGGTLGDDAQKKVHSGNDSYSII